MPPARKRAHQVVDLTGEDDAPPVAKAPRTTASHASSSQGGYIGPSSIYAGLSQLAASMGPDARLSYQQPRDPFDDESEELLDLTQSDDGPIREFYGSIDNKIVGCRYYNGIVTPNEVVVLRREPSNP